MLNTLRCENRRNSDLFTTLPTSNYDVWYAMWYAMWLIKTVTCILGPVQICGDPLGNVCSSDVSWLV